MSYCPSVRSLCTFLFLMMTSYVLIAQCAPKEGEVTIFFQGDENLLLDNSRWELVTEDNELVASGNHDSTFCVPSIECYTFIVYDDYGDGLAGSLAGFYQVFYNSEEIARNVNYGSEERVIFGGCRPGSSCFTPLAARTGETYIVTEGQDWYIFIPSQTGEYELSTCNDNTNCNTTIWIYDRCLGLTNRLDQEEAILFNEDDCSDEKARISGILTAGEMYYFRIGSSDNSCTGTSFEWTFSYLGGLSGCTDPTSCNYDPLAIVDDGSCLYGNHPNCPDGPDLIIKPGVLLNTLRTDVVSESGCYVNEGCLQGYGPRQVIRFTTHIQNVGNQDYTIGAPETQSGQFEWDACHGHWHYEGYAEYRMYNSEGVALPVGFKNGFCVLDLECDNGGQRRYSCGYMGIAAGCGDYYYYGLDCQWIDVTDLPDGQYSLVLVVNWDRSPDLFGREEINYENNLDVVCFELSRNGSGQHQVTPLDGWGCYTDCNGIVGGQAQPDCFGICGGDNLHGDVNGNGVYETGDISMYINGILDRTIPVTSCTELTQNDAVDIEDVAWLMDCILVEENADGHQSHAHSCQLPTIGITNPNESIELAIADHSPDLRYVDIGIRNRSAIINSVHFQLAGLTLDRAELLPNGSNYSPQLFTRPDGQVIVFPYNTARLPRASDYRPFVRLYYSDIDAAGACIVAIRTAVNGRMERIAAQTSAFNCTDNLLTCYTEEASVGDEDEDGVCDNIDRCPNGDDNMDTDEDGVPDACDLCPGIADVDEDEDGVCDTIDICLEGDDNLDTDEDGTPDACDSCPLSATDDSDNDGVCDDVDVCIGMEDSLLCQTVSLRLELDRYPQETSWIIRNTITDQVACSGDNYDNQPSQIIDIDCCLIQGQYEFIIYDQANDGLCCGFGEGSYTLSMNDGALILAEGGQFTSQETIDFSISVPFPDEDNDGVCDAADQCPGHPDSLDADQDGTPDACDQCPDSDDAIDSDNDGTPDGCDTCPNAATGDSDGDGVCDDIDICAGSDDNVDSDNDGTPDGCDTCPDAATDDSDGDGVCDDIDICAGSDDNVDSDNDGTPDGCDTCPNAATGDSDGDGVCDDIDICAGSDDNVDSDNDGTPDGCDTCPDAATDDSDGDGVCDDIDICAGADDNVDSDNDGTPDGCDTCPDAATGDSDGDGVCDDIDICAGSDDNVDSDNDGTPDGCDTCPNAATGDSDGDGVCDDIDICAGSDDNVDSDNDGTPDGCDTCPDAATGDSDGDGVCDDIDICAGSDDNVDSDNDGTPDGCDTCPNAATGDSDGDGVCDDIDICAGSDDNVDSDNDGTPDGCDTCPNAATGDSDGDGVCDDIDICAGSDDNVDSDNDGTPDGCDTCPNAATGDSDGDGVCDDIDICAGSDDNVDSDNDGTPDGCDTCPNAATGDSDGDGVCDDIDICAGSDDNVDSDNDGTPDGCDTCPDAATDDSDGDGVCDDIDICAGSDDNVDSDNDGTPDGCDTCPNAATGDSDSDGVCDDIDICAGSDDNVDSDNDGTPDGCDTCPGYDDTADMDNDGIPDGCDNTVDSDQTTVSDDLHIIEDLFPNPTNNILQVRFQKEINGQIAIFNMYGGLIWEQDIAAAISSTLDVNSLAAGGYYLMVTTEQGRVIKRFVKTN